MELDSNDIEIISDRMDMVDTLLGEDKFADTVLCGANFVNVISREVYIADIAIKNKYILMIGNCKDLIGKRTVVLDMKGKFVAPGLIDVHVHLKSSMLTITEFTRLSLSSGTTCLMIDTYEMADALGAEGIKAMTEETLNMPQHVFYRSFSPTSCIMRSDKYHNYTQLRDFTKILSHPTVTGVNQSQSTDSIREIYRYRPDIIKDKIISGIYAEKLGYGIDSSGTELSDRNLAAHIISSGTNISCYEITSKEEAVEKLRNGIYVLIREGSAANSISESLKAITEEKMDSRRVILGTDDVLTEDMLSRGYMCEVVRRTIEQGVDPVEAIQMATINPATWLGLTQLGVLAPGKMADLIVINGELKNMNIDMVFLEGKLAAKDNELLLNLPKYLYPNHLKNSLKREFVKPFELMVQSEGNMARIRCIGLIINRNLTGLIEANMETSNGYILPDLKNDILSVSVVGLEEKSSIGNSFVKGFKLERGAIAKSISGSEQNIIVAGTNHEDMAAAVNEIIRMQGGIAVAKDNKVIGSLKLPIAGVMTDEMTSYELIGNISYINRIVKEELKCRINEPLMHLDFLSLITAPKWKITNEGLLDVDKYCITETIIR